MLQLISTKDYSDDIVAALATPGGHLSIGRGGFTLYHRHGAMLSGYGCEAIKAQASRPVSVIDSRNVDFDVVLQLTLCGPLVAVGREPEPFPWHGLSYAPLQAVAFRYAAAGAEVWNIPDIETMPVVAKHEIAP